MKKLLVTVVGAVTALGAFAALQSDTVLQFENLDGVITTNGLNTALGNYFSHGEGASNNTYTVNAANIGTCTVPSQIGEDPTTKALDIKTTFGNPLDVSVVAGGTPQDIDTGIYFDSLVKFTVCEDAPTQTYDGAKIVMWLQSEDGTGPTNLMVKAGSLSYELGVQVTAATYECALPTDFDADAFHRVTIKSIKNITTSTTDDVPGFAIYIDQATVGTSTAKWDATFSAQYGLTEAASHLNTQSGDLFPSLVQSGSATQLTKAGFDGTGSITDIVFTDDAPTFAKDYVAPQVSVVIGTDTVPVTTLAGAVTAANDASAGQSVVITLLKGMELEGTLAFNSAANVTLDFAGVILTNKLADTAAISNAGNLTITNSSVNVGGVYCDPEVENVGAAVVQGGDGALVISGGMFDGNVNFTEALDVTVTGGSFKNDETYFETEERDSGTWIADGKTMVANAETGLNDVVDIVTYKVIYVYGLNGEYATTNDELEVGATTPAAPAAAAIVGYELTWTPEIAATVTADVTYTAQYEPNSWAAFLGEAVNGAYEIDDLAELVKFKDGVAKLGTSGQNFRLAADIDAGSLEYWDGIGTASGTIDSSATSKKGLNNCTFDGAGHTISNVKFTNAKYRGFFNQVLDSTIKDLTINVVDIAQPQSSSAEHGYSAFAGNMKNSKIQNCKATGTIGTTAKPAMHTCGGFAVKSAGGNVFENCTNYVNIVCSLNDNPKIGGIVGLAQDGAAAFTNCWNYGDVTITCKKCANAGNGAGGLVGYGSKAITIYGGGNAGTIQSTDTTADGGTHPIKVGTIIAMQNDTSATVSGGVVAQADAAPAGAFANISGLNFATVDSNVATFVADNALAAGNTYKVMATGVTPTYEFAEAGTIAFDTALAVPTTYAITATGGLEVTDATEGTVRTFTAAAPKTPTVDPTGTGTIDCASATEAASVADAINAAKETYITKPSTVADATTYYSYVQAVADGTAVKVALTAAGEAAAQASANTDVAQLPVANAAAADAEASIDSVAGLYYSILSGTAPTAVTTEGTRVVGNGGKITLTLPKQTGAAGFYKVKVSATAQ